MHTSVELYNGSLKRKERRQYRNCFNNAAKKMTMAHEKWKSDMHSNANMTIHLTPFSPTIHADAIRATSHSYALHSLAGLRATFFSILVQQLEKVNKSTHTLHAVFRVHMREVEIPTSRSQFCQPWDATSTRTLTVMETIVFCQMAHKDPLSAQWAHKDSLNCLARAILKQVRTCKRKTEMLAGLPRTLATHDANSNSHALYHSKLAVPRVTRINKKAWDIVICIDAAQNQPTNIIWHRHMP